MTFPQDLQNLLANPGGQANPHKDLFDAAWEIVKECGEEERHFNQLQSVYRGVASTWLLATFGAVGYLLFNKEGSIAHPWLAALISIMGAFGIGLLWMLDLSVYHRLLVAVFNQGKALEDRFPWLPKIRTHMLNDTHGGVRKRLVIYYLFTTLGPLVAGVALFYYYHYRCAALTAIGAGALLIGTLLTLTLKES